MNLRACFFLLFCLLRSSPRRTKSSAAMCSAVGQDGNEVWKAFVKTELKEGVDVLDGGKTIISRFSAV